MEMVTRNMKWKCETFKNRETSHHVSSLFAAAQSRVQSMRSPGSIRGPLPWVPQSAADSGYHRHHPPLPPPPSIYTYLVYFYHRSNGQTLYSLIRFVCLDPGNVKSRQWSISFKAKSKLLSTQSKINFETDDGSTITFQPLSDPSLQFTLSTYLHALYLINTIQCMDSRSSRYVM